MVFARPGELRHMEWTEIDWEKFEWEIALEKIKMRRQISHNHIVPLSTQTIDILREQHLFTGNGRYVFPGVSGRNRPLSGMALGWRSE